MSGPQENLRVLQSYEAEYAKRVAFAEEGFRDPKVLAGDSLGRGGGQAGSMVDSEKIVYVSIDVHRLSCT